MSTPSANLTETQQRILAAASGLIARKGVQGTSLADIAEAAGMRKGTLYYHYASKEELVYDIADAHLEQLSREIVGWLEGPGGSEGIGAILEAVFRKVTEATGRNRLHLYLLGEAGSANPALAARFRDRYRQLKETITQAMRRVLPDPEAATAPLASLVLATLDGLVIQSMLDDQPLPLADIARRLGTLA